MYYKYLTEKERNKIEEIETRIKNANTNNEVELLKEQIGLIMERILIRKQIENQSK